MLILIECAIKFEPKEIHSIVQKEDERKPKQPNADYLLYIDNFEIVFSQSCLVNKQVTCFKMC